MQVIRIFGIKLICYSDKPDIMRRKILFYVVSAVNGVTPKTRQVLYDHTADFSGFNVREHTLKSLAVKVGSGCTIIYVSIINTKFRFIGKVILQNHFLCFDRITALFVIFHR